MKKVRRHLTYANVMSSIAVFLIVGGGAAYAAITLPKNSVGTRELKPRSVKSRIIAKRTVKTVNIAKNAVTGAKVKESTLGTVPNARKLGGKRASAYQKGIRWALVRSDGSIARQSGGIAVSRVTAGVYYVNFGTDVSTGDLFANTVVSGSSVGGAVSLMSCADSGATGFSSCLGGVQPQEVMVATLNPSGALADEPFYVGATAG